MPSGKYLDILLRCLQLLTVCSISFQAWAVLYEHISHIAKAEIKFEPPRKFESSNKFRENFRENKYCRENVRENLPKPHA
jgi:hypothetical protein